MYGKLAELRSQSHAPGQDHGERHRAHHGAEVVNRVPVIIIVLLLSLVVATRGSRSSYDCTCGGRRRRQRCCRGCCRRRCRRRGRRAGADRGCTRAGGAGHLHHRRHVCRRGGGHGGRRRQPRRPARRHGRGAGCGHGCCAWAWPTGAAGTRAARQGSTAATSWHTQQGSAAATSWHKATIAASKNTTAQKRERGERGGGTNGYPQVRNKLILQSQLNTACSTTGHKYCCVAFVSHW